jgi:transcriptional regulator with XRE-family HTH domain
VTSDFGRRLSRLRRQAGMTQEELAQRSGVAVRTIRSIETSDVANPRLKTVHLLADTLASPLEMTQDALRQLLAPAMPDGTDLTQEPASAGAMQPPVPRPPTPRSPDPLAGPADKLAWQVRERWRREEEQRRVNDPFPLPVRWTAAPGHLIDHWESVRDAPPGAAAAPLALVGGLDQIADVTGRSRPGG